MKGLFQSSLILCLCLSGLAFSGARELKEQVKGTWALDEKATLARLKQTHKAKAKPKAERKTEMKAVKAYIRSHAITYQFQPDRLTVTEAGSSDSYGLTIRRAAGKMIVFGSSRIDTVLNTSVQYSVFFPDDDHIVITSSADESLSTYVWKRVKP